MFNILCQTTQPDVVTPFAELGTITSIVGATMIVTGIAKRALANVPALQHVPTWIYAILIACGLTAVANLVLHSLEGNFWAQAWKAALAAATASGFFSWYNNAGDTPKSAAIDNATKTISLLLLALLPSFMMTGCFGKHARDIVIAPALMLASDGVQNDAMAGVATLPKDGQTEASLEINSFFAAIRTKDRKLIASDAMPRWQTVKFCAETGIAAKVGDGRLTAQTALSSRERLKNFEAALLKSIEKLE